MVRTSFPKEFDADDTRDINGNRAELRSLASTLVSTIVETSNVLPVVEKEHVTELKRLASDVAVLRTHIHRDGSSHEIASYPESEAPARLTNQFLKLAKGLAWIRNKPKVSEDEMNLVRRVARDTVPQLRVKLIEAVNAGSPTIDAIAFTTGLPRRTIERTRSLWFAANGFALLLPHKRQGLSQRYDKVRREQCA